MLWREFLITAFVIGVNSQEDIVKGQITETEYGKVKGTYRFALGSDRPIYSYFGIRYGRRPDYVFRFRPAEEPWTWDGLFDATNENRPLCFQDREQLQDLRKNTYFRYLVPDKPKMSEDCLFVDVFTPLSAKEVKTRINLLPVVAWIHGGSFQKFASTSKLWAMPAYEDVVLVQIQYRVGLFGFLTTDDNWAPANCALHDQLKALYWIKRNIKAFGGNPEAVTIMGESAGSVAVTTLMLSSASKNLFHRAIAISGAPDTMLWKNGQRKNTNRIAKRLNCFFDNNAYTSTCLRNKINSTRIMEAARNEKITFTLQTDEVFMPVSPRKMIDAKSFGNSVPLLLGTASGEMDFLLSRRLFKESYDKGSEVTRRDVEKQIHAEMEKYYPDGNINDITKLIEKSYLNTKEVANEGIGLLRGMLHALADQMFVSRAVNFADKLKETGQQVYFFEFAHKPRMYKARPELFPRKYNWTSGDHSDDLMFFLGLPFIDEISGKDAPLMFTKEEKNLSKKMMKFIAKFAATGKPMSEWSQYPDYMLIKESFTMKNQSYKPERMKLWNEIIPSLS